jgi:hypothetical protein
MRNPQLNKNGELQHLLTIDGLPRASSRRSSTPPRPSPKWPSARSRSCRCCAARACSTCSSRTRRAPAPPSRSPPSACRPMSSTSTSTPRRPAKGETLLDTVDNLCAMHADMFVVRHESSGAPHLIAQHLQNTGRDTSTSSTPATGAMPTRRRACSTCTPSATTRRISATCAWPSSATCCTRAWRVRRSTPDHAGRAGSARHRARKP